MPDETIRSSVGMVDGTKPCRNQPADVATVVRLLNLIAPAEGGRHDNPIKSNPNPRELSQAVHNFQRVQNGLGNTPKLSVDGHVDPNERTIERLNRMARKKAPATFGGTSFTVASLSWIDPMRLPERGVIETDRGAPGRTLTKSDAKESRVCRFSNVLEGVVAFEGDRVTAKAFGPDSGLHMRPSFRGTMPQSFPTRRQIIDLPDGVEFRQLVGCRTQAPELTAAEVGGVGGLLARINRKLGRAGEQLGKMIVRLGPIFPPIWTELSLIIKVDGTRSASVVRHSLFPSMSFYTQIATTTSLELLQYYDGTASRFDEWFIRGWGPGNPFGVPFPNLTDK